MYTYKTLFVLFLLLQSVKSFLSEIETKIFLTLVRDNYVKSCLIAPREITEHEAVKLVKTLSENQVYSVFLKRNNLRKYLESIDMTIYHWTIVVLKEEELNSTNYFSNQNIISSYFWLLFDTSNGTLRHELVQIQIPFDTALLLIEKKQKDNYILSEYYKIKKHDPGILQFYAEWKNNSLTSVDKDWFDRKSNMHKYEFVTLTFKEDLYLIPKEKLNEAIWEELSELLNFTIKPKAIEYCPNRKIKELDTGEEEEALLDTQIYVGNDEKFSHLLGPTDQSGLYMHIRAEREYEGFTRFLKPFSKETWLSILLWVLLCGIFDFLVEYLSRSFSCSDKPPKECFLNIFTPLDCLCNQSGLETSSNLSSRVMLFLMRISAIVITYAYAATFISYLLLFIPQLPFTDLKGFIEDGSYKIIAERNSEVDIFFNVSAQPLEKVVFQKFLSDVSKWSRLDNEIDRVCNGEKLVLVAYDDDVDRYRPCNIVKIQNPLKVFVNGFRLRLKSPFRGLLRIKLLLLRTSGILQKLKNHIFYKHITYKKDEIYEINIEKVSAIFTIHYYGFMMSIGVLILEFLFKRHAASIKSDLQHLIKCSTSFLTEGAVLSCFLYTVPVSIISIFTLMNLYYLGFINKNDGFN